MTSVPNSTSVMENSVPPNAAPCMLALSRLSRNSSRPRDQSSAMWVMRMPIAANGGHPLSR